MTQEGDREGALAGAAARRTTDLGTHGTNSTEGRVRNTAPSARDKYVTQPSGWSLQNTEKGSEHTVKWGLGGRDRGKKKGEKVVLWGLMMMCLQLGCGEKEGL